MNKVATIIALSLFVVACSSGGGGGVPSDSQPASSSTQSGDSSPDASEPRGCGDNGLYNESRTTACRACLERSCCAELTACAADKQCTRYMNCWNDLRCTRFEDPGCSRCVRDVIDAPGGYVGSPTNDLWDCKGSCWAQCTP